ncbi:deleted in malignant brain tumors 1 protein-like [Lytechinus pictus]|uniref:deleted in malignant brain tumors 1 protein-like n=1 Tax=Lytechinus pictus TaxID=7653 RepID=UPI0030B9D552
MSDARVVCKMLGFDGALGTPGAARFGQGSGIIFLNEVECNRAKDNLADCFHRGIGNWSYCGHERDAGVICYSGDPLRIRLVGGHTNAEGRVEVLFDGSWGTICDTRWDLRDARVVCRMLGFDGALGTPGAARFGQGSGIIFLDEVECYGAKDNLADCFHRGIGNWSYCGHERDAGVICYSGDPFEIRLVGGPTDAEGRVEVLYDGSWGTICDESWDLSDARVVCTILGFDGALGTPGAAWFGQGSGIIFLDEVECYGAKDNLADCFHRGIGNWSYCGHERDAGVICYSGDPLRIRLVGGPTNAEGRVEVLYDGSWGTICDNRWDLRDARVVSRMLGFDGALGTPGVAKFGQGTGIIFLDEIECDGTEDNIADCFRRGIGNWSYCGHERDAAVICYLGDPFEIRLVGGPTDAEGRVEVLYDGSWGTICDESWDLSDARVVCTMLGFNGALGTPGAARFGQGSGIIFLDEVECYGAKDNLADCFHRGIGNWSYCGHERDAAVICYLGDPFDIRLVGGPTDAEGRVEVLYDGSWGTICDESWDLSDARVVCTMLGFNGALGTPGAARFGQGSGIIFLDEVECYGAKDNLADCFHRGIGNWSYCGHERDAAVICYLGDPFEIRLVGGPTDAEGRVEVLYDGSWGTICDESWDLSDARVVCTILGFDGALGTPGAAWFGQGSGIIFLDEVECYGAKDNLADCFHRGIGNWSYCGHERDAGVICYSGDPFEIRLVGGPTNAEGRVEVFYDGSWGTICDNRWDLRDARVVCRMLGFDGALGTPGAAWFGQGSGIIFLDEVECYGAKDNLADCFHRGIGNWSYCGHERDAGVICYSGDPLRIRLVGGPTDAEGRVEVLYDGSWGTICDDWWDLAGARVVCRMIGFDGALGTPGAARFGQGTGIIILDEVQCDGTEDNLADCFHRGIGNWSYCGHERDASVICYSGDPFEVRLVGGPTDAEGRVEVLYDGSWGTICDDWWDLEDARVVCRMLGFDGALGTPGAARFGQGTGIIILDEVQCFGVEDNLADCFHRGIGNWSYCGHERDAGVICYSGDPFEIRLVGGPTNAEGRVEVLYDGSWGTICDDDWDLRDASVVCRMLVFDGALGTTTSARFGQGSGRILLTKVECFETENNLADCFHRGIGNWSYCGHERDAGAVCYSGEHPNPFKVRLVGGSNEAEGRVEVLHDGSWGTICDDDWDLRDARVVCRMLGFGGALGAPGSARFGQGSGIILLDELSCIGTEDNIAECPHQGIGDHDCMHVEDAGAICYTGEHPNPLQVRLFGGSTNVEGRVEVMHDGSWGTVCDINWDLRDARVVCRMLGFDGALKAPRSARFGQGSGRSLLYGVECDGTEGNLADCAHAGIGRYSCSNSMDAGALCYSGKNPDPLQVRLAGGSNDAEGRVEVLHDGSWGTICDGWWDVRDARVVCRMRGFDGAFEAPKSARFGQGSGRVLLTFVNCEGGEDNLADCAHAGIGRYTCNHARDAGAICYSEDLQSNNVHGELFLWLVICIPVSSFMVLAAFVFGLCQRRMKRAKQSSDTSTYMDLMHSRSVDRQDLTYQDLSSPPKLPERWSAVTSPHNKSQIISTESESPTDVSHDYTDINTVFDKKSNSHDEINDDFLSSTAKDSEPRVYMEIGKKSGEAYYENRIRVKRKTEISRNDVSHKYMDMRPIGQKNSETHDTGFDGYLLPTSASMSKSCLHLSEGTPPSDVAENGNITVQDKAHKYMNMNIAYQKPAYGSDLDIDGYLLPDITSANTDQDIDGYLLPSFTSTKRKVIPNNQSNINRSNQQQKVHQWNKYYGRSWMTVCGVWWGLEDARILCRMLGYDGALEAGRITRFGHGSGGILFVDCYGSEESLTNCSDISDATTYCKHEWDAGVICYSGDPFEIRLVGGPTNAEGRVELLYDGSWGTICDDDWDPQKCVPGTPVDAQICVHERPLTMIGQGSTMRSSGQRFHNHDERILTHHDIKRDSSHEYTEMGTTTKTVSANREEHSYAYNIHPTRRQEDSRESTGNGQFINQNKPQGSWMAVCGGVLFNLNDARIVCRMLGYDGVLEAGRLTRFGHGSDGILFVDCSGSEESLVGCYDVSDATTYCEHKWDAGAICYSGDPFEVRLVGGTNDAEGRVEVLYNGSWGTVCGISWDLRDAWVVCAMLGFDGALEAPRSARFSEGYGPILLDWVECYGTEDSIADCIHRGIGDWSYCGHDRDAGVICYSGDPFEVRLAGGSNNEGRVEVSYNGSWGTICDDEWDLRDARVVCRMLRFGGALEAPRSARFGQGFGRVLLTWVGCDGTEDNLADCIHRGIGDWSYCDHDRDAGVICYSGANPDPFKVRLVGGSNDAEGRVEVMHNGSWGTICDDDWDLRDARVVCKMLGFDGALEAPRSARFGQGSGHILLNYASCEGTEDNLADCAHPGIGRYSYSCSHAMDAGAICLSEIRLAGGLNDAEGRVEVLHDGSWRTICDDDWDLRDVRVVCRMLGFDGALEAPRSARFGHGSGPIHLLFVGCDGTEDNLADCSHVGIGRFSCSQSRNAGAICFSRGRLGIDFVYDLGF